MLLDLCVSAFHKTLALESTPLMPDLAKSSCHHYILLGPQRWVLKEGAQGGVMVAFTNFNSFHMGRNSLATFPVQGLQSSLATP